MSDSEFEVSDSFEDQSSRRNPTPVFRFKNKSIGFLFHKNVDEEAKVTLAQEIKNHGGTILSSAVGADTLLIAPTQDRTVIQLACNSSRNAARSKLRVEYTTFIGRCTKRGYFRHARQTINPMHGVPEGYGRTKFTPEDFENLCWFISRLLPDISMGGRQSLKFYTDLVKMGRESEYAWTRRHTAESWKENYKRNKQAYNIRIQELVDQHPPDPERRWIYDRRLTKASLQKHTGMQSRLNEDESSGSESSQVDSQDEGNTESKGSLKLQKRKYSAFTSGTMQSAKKRLRLPEKDDNPSGEESPEKFEYSEEEQQQDSLFDGNDDAEFQFDDYGPGPSHEPRSPERTLVASVGYPPFPTQDTLVGTPATKPAQVAGKQASVHRSNSEQTRYRRVATSTPPPIDPPAILSPPVEATPRPVKPLLKAARRRSVQPPDSTENISVPQRQQQQSNQHKSPRVKEALLPIVEVRSKLRKKKRNDGVAVRASSRLRSIEPEIVPLPGRRKARKYNAIAIPEDQGVYEAPTVETLAEELSVEHILEEYDHDINSLPQPSELSMDSDDIRISAELRPRSSDANGTKKFDFRTAPHPKDMLKRSQPAVRSESPRRGNRDTPQTTTQTWDKARQNPHKSAPSILGNETLTTSRRQRRGSSADTYPLPGTRAESMVQSLQKVESQSPYSPPIGTKAAAFSQRQR